MNLTIKKALKMGAILSYDNKWLVIYADKANRVGASFHCSQCGFKGNSDIVGATNILKLGRVARDHSFPKLITGGD